MAIIQQLNRKYLKVPGYFLLSPVRAPSGQATGNKDLTYGEGKLPCLGELVTLVRTGYSQ